MKNHFTIVVPAYNVEQWAEKNIKSALTQDYDNYDVIYINDASTDETRKIVDSTFQNLVKETNADSKVMHNESNKKALYNIITAVKLAPPNSIIVTLDGDDSWEPPVAGPNDSQMIGYEISWNEDLLRFEAEKDSDDSKHRWDSSGSVWVAL